jgi:hypothetical protein
MRLAGTFAVRVGAVAVAAWAILAPVTAAHAATPTISVTPATGLVDGQTVTVTGSGFSAGAPFFFVECNVIPPPGTACESSTAVQGVIGGDGSVSATPFTVHKGAVGNGSCPPAKAGNTCYLVLTTDQNLSAAKTAAAPISFVPPAVTVTPSNGVKNGDSVMVSGTGFAPSTGVFAVECAPSGSSAPPAEADCDGDTLGTGETDASGGFSGVRMMVHTGAVGDKTCGAGGSCDIVVTTSVTDPDASDSGIGTFTFAAAAGPMITLDPSTNVTIGGHITVSGSGFAASQTVNAIECSGASGQVACDTNASGIGQTDASGAFTGVVVPVHSGAVGNGTCNPGQICYVAATTDPSGTDPTQRATAPFTFTSGGGGGTGKAATKTKAAYSAKQHVIAGVVNSGGDGVKGVKTKLEIKKHSDWKVVDHGKTHAGGVVVFDHVTKSGTYEIKALRNHHFKGSTSNKVTV